MKPNTNQGEEKEGLKYFKTVLPTSHLKYVIVSLWPVTIHGVCLSISTVAPFSFKT